MGFSGGSLFRGSEWSCPSNHPVRGVRGLEWPPGQLRVTSMVSLLSNRWLPDWGLGIW